MATSRGHGSRPRSASLKALPPDGVGTEAPSVSAAAAHWTVKEKASASTGSASNQRHRPLKSVSLKLGKGCDASPTSSSRSNSAGGQGWGSGELFIDSRRSASQATGSSCGSGPPSRESTAREASQHAAYPPHGGGAVSRAPLQPLQPGQPAAGGGREKLLSSTAPAAVGRPPPAPARSALGSAAAGEAPPSSAGDRRRGAGAALRSPDISGHSGGAETDSSRRAADISSHSGGSRSSRPGRGSPKSGEKDGLLNQDDLPSRPGSSYERAAATYAALPKTPGAARTLLQDADGFIFRPAVEAEVKPMPRGLRRGQPQPQLANSRSGSRNLAAALFTGAPATEASAGEGQRPLPTSLQGYREQVLQLQAKAKRLRQEVLQEPEPPEAPRIAWSDGPGSAGEQEADEEDTLELAQQIRRDFLSRQVMEEEKADEEEPGDAEPDNQAEAKQQEATTADSWVFRTDDARRSMAELEESLSKAKERADRDRLELGGYLNGLRSKTFQVEADDSANAAEDELLVSMPPDFEDVVDINASLAAADRRSRARGKKQDENSAGEHPPSASAASGSTARNGGGSSGNATEKDGFRMPSFLEKYFLEDKAEQLPIVRLQQEEERAVNAPKEMSELEKGLRQIAKLDSLLTSREAVGAAKLKVARQELDATKERLRVESESSEQEKFQILRQLKEKGMLRSSAPSCASVGSSRAPSEPSHSALNSARGSTTSLVPAAMPASPSSGGGPVDWSGWACSVAEAEPAPRAAALQLLQREPLQDAGATAARQDKAEEDDEPDTGTFSLTSERANLGSLGSLGAKTGSRPMPTKLLEPVIEAEDTLAATAEDLASEDGEEIELEAPPLALQDDDYAADPYDLDAIRSIDEKLAKLVPEAEWEAKSIHSLPMGQDAGSTAAGEEGGGGARSSKARSIWSHRSSSGQTLPGDPTLREQLEERESQKALQNIDERLQELQDLEQQSARALGPATPVLSPEELQKLLMQAAAQSALPHAEDKVLALTAQAEDLQQSLKQLQQRPSGASSSALAIFEPSHAREILTNLSEQMEDWDTAFAEAKFSLDQVEQGLRTLEDETAAQEQAPPPESEDPAVQEAVAVVSQIASRLEELGKEATAFAERSLESEAVVPTILDDEAGPEAEDLGPALPRLAGAGEADEDDDDLGSFLEDDDMGGTLAPESADPEPVLEARSRLGPSEELRKALELDIPAGDGLWSDADLDRLSKAMDAHFGDVLVTVPAAEPRAERESEEPEEADVDQ